MRHKNTRYLTILAASLSIAFGAVSCSDTVIDDKQAKQIVKQWMKARSALADDCSAQQAETLDAALTNSQVKKPAWKAWKNANKSKFKQFKKLFSKKFCNKNTGGLGKDTAK